MGPEEGGRPVDACAYLCSPEAVSTSNMVLLRATVPVPPSHREDFLVRDEQLRPYNKGPASVARTHEGVNHTFDPISKFKSRSHDRH